MAKKPFYYDVLGLDQDATNAQIKRAYIENARKWHPDKNLDNKEEAEEKFKQVIEAYTILSNEDTRKAYLDMINAGYPEKEAQDRVRDFNAQLRQREEDAKLTPEDVSTRDRAQREAEEKAQAHQRQAEEAKRQEQARQRQAEEAAKRQQNYQKQQQQSSPAQRTQTPRQQPQPTRNQPKGTEVPYTKPTPSKPTPSNRTSGASRPFYGRNLGTTHFQNNVAPRYSLREIDPAIILCIAAMLLERRRQQQILAMMLQFQSPIFVINIDVSTVERRSTFRIR